jgi:hypothetical protein
VRESPSTTYGTTLASVRCAHCRYKRNVYDCSGRPSIPNCFNSKD